VSPCGLAQRRRGAEGRRAGKLASSAEGRERGAAWKAGSPRRREGELGRESTGSGGEPGAGRGLEGGFTAEGAEGAEGVCRIRIRQGGSHRLPPRVGAASRRDSETADCLVQRRRGEAGREAGVFGGRPGTRRGLEGGFTAEGAEGAEEGGRARGVPGHRKLSQAGQRLIGNTRFHLIAQTVPKRPRFFGLTYCRQNAFYPTPEILPRLAQILRDKQDKSGCAPSDYSPSPSPPIPTRTMAFPVHPGKALSYQLPQENGS